MGQPIRTLALISGLLAAGSFAYVVVFAPIPDPPERPRAQNSARQRTAGLGQLDQSFRSAMVQGNFRAAENLSEQMIIGHRNRRVTWYNRGLVLTRIGKTEDAWSAWNELEEVTNESMINEPDQDARRAYFLGWAARGLGKDQEARDLFTQTSELYETGHPQRPIHPGVAYNLACYWALAGDHERAIGYWEDALTNGYSDQSQWWVGDPDLDPIRDDPRFYGLARTHGYID